MKITWGHKLIGVFIVFGIMMTYMVYRSFGTRVDLVSREYYDDELEYQQLINGARSVSDQGSALRLAVDGRIVTITGQDSAISTLTSGIAWFYCVSDSDKDQKVALNNLPDSSGALATVLLPAGKYIAKLRWTTASGDFYTEEKFNVR